MKLRDYQNNCITDLRQSYTDGHRSPLLVLPTGAGKTIVFTWIAANATGRVLILVHRKELLRQTSEKLTAFGVDHGMISPHYKPKYDERVQVASVQTLVNRFDKVDTPDLIIIDEAHHATASMWRKIFDRYDCRKLGVTATPHRADGSGLDDIFDSMVIGPSVAELIRGGYLTKPKVYAPAKVDLSGVRVQRGDYVVKDLNDVMNERNITGDVIKYYRQLANDTPAVVFCVSIDHAESVAYQFASVGYRAAAVHGQMKPEQRDEILTGLGERYDVVCSCDLISEGTDIPAIGCAILLRPTISEGLYLQQVGRALRTYEGRTHAIILDHVGNVIRHGMPDEDREWDLKGREKTTRQIKNEVQCSECPECFAVFAPARVCPECGHERKVESKEIEQVEGELIEVQSVEKRREQGRARSYADLVKLGYQRGYKSPEYWAKKVIENRRWK